MTLGGPWRSLAMAGAALGIYAVPGAAPALWLDTPHLVHGPWRLFTAHWVHHSPSHLGWDTLGFLAVAAALETIAPRRLLPTLALAAPVVSLAVLPTLGPDAAFGGLSGLASALFAALSLALVRSDDPRDRIGGGALGLAFVAKLAAEATGGGVLFAAADDGVVHVTLAHLVGGASGAVAALLPWRTER